MRQKRMPGGPFFRDCVMVLYAPGCRMGQKPRESRRTGLDIRIRNLAEALHKGDAQKAKPR